MQRLSCRTISFYLMYFGYFYSASSSSLLLKGASDYSIDTVLESTRWRATGNYKWRSCPRSLRGGYCGIRTCNLPDARHWTYHWATMPHNSSSYYQHWYFHTHKNVLARWTFDPTVDLLCLPQYLVHVRIYASIFPFQFSIDGSELHFLNSYY